MTRRSSQKIEKVITFSNRVVSANVTSPDWQASVDVSNVLERYSDFDPRLLKIIRFTIQSCFIQISSV